MAVIFLCHGCSVHPSVHESLWYRQSCHVLCGIWHSVETLWTCSFSPPWCSWGKSLTSFSLGIHSIKYGKASKSIWTSVVPRQYLRPKVTIVPHFTMCSWWTAWNSVQTRLLSTVPHHFIMHVIFSHSRPNISCLRSPGTAKAQPL